MQEFTLDTDFPGGNALLEKMEGDTVFLRQDLRDTATDWFYWAFRVRGAAGRRLTFHFTASDVLGVRGAAASTDGGKTWAWLGAESVVRTDGKGPSFSHAFPADASEVFFAFCPLYTQANLEAFLAGHRTGSAFQGSALRRDLLCRSRAGRDVELLRREAPSPRFRILLTARHHACETLASFCLEGLLDAALADDELGHWFSEHTAMAAVPFMDKDGVEAGDQGKNRSPYDHNRDYGGELLDSIYPEVRSLRRWAGTWMAKGKTGVVMDLHCPWIRGDRNEEVYFVGLPDKRVWKKVTDFSHVLESCHRGTLPYTEARNLPFGQDWNVGTSGAIGAKTCARWGSELPGAHFATSLEVPYASASGVEVTPDSARALGRDLALALRTYLAALEPAIV